MPLSDSLIEVIVRSPKWAAAGSTAGPVELARLTQLANHFETSEQRANVLAAEAVVDALDSGLVEQALADSKMAVEETFIEDSSAVAFPSPCRDRQLLSGEEATAPATPPTTRPSRTLLSPPASSFRCRTSPSVALAEGTSASGLTIDP